MGLASGAVALLFGYEPLAGLFPDGGNWLLIFQAGFAVFLSVFVMVTTDTEHPPASGTAMGVVLAGPGPFWSSAFFVLASCLLLSILQMAMKKRLKDLV